jgi:HEAT repeat protein
MHKEISNQKIKKLRKFVFVNSVHEIVKLLEDHPEYTQTMIRFLSSDNQILVKKAVESLGEIRDATATLSLIECHASNNNEVKGLIVNAIKKIGEPAIITLLKILENYDLETEKSRNSSIEILGKLKQKRALDFLFEILKKGTLPDQKSAAKALRLIGINDQQYNSIVDLLEDKYNETGRLGAAVALGQVGKPASIEKLIKSFERRRGKNQYLFEMIISAGKIIRRNPDCMESKKAFSFLVDISREEFEIQELVIKTFVSIGKPAVTHLLEYLDDPWSKNHPQYILSQMGKTAVPELVKTLKDKNRRKGAAKILNDMGYMDVELADQVLCYVLLARDNEYFNYFYLEESVPCHLIELLKDSDEKVRTNAATALGSLEVTDDQLSKISNFVYDSGNSDLRLAATEALYEISIPKSVSVLIYALGDDEVNVRNIAYKALEKLAQRYMPAEEAIEFEKSLQDGYEKLNKRFKGKIDPITMVVIGELRMKIAKRKNVLARDKGVIIDSKPAPPDKKMYQQIRRSIRNG